jgi:prepilin-type processing-associated H-X9-DG protein
MTPISQVMGLKIPNPDDPSQAGRAARYSQLARYAPFQCPENQFLSAPFQTGTKFTTELMGSYNTAMVFLFMNTTETGPYGLKSGATTNQRIFGATFYNPPTGYAPKLNRIGISSEKIYIADGARYSQAGTPPDYDTSVFGSTGGAYSDVGAYSSFSHSWDRTKYISPGTAGVDSRIYAFRHGSIQKLPRADAMKMNCGFYDGHVELLGDLEGGNPRFWMPKGTTIQSVNTEMWPDTLAKYVPAGMATYQCP